MFDNGDSFDDWGLVSTGPLHSLLVVWIDDGFLSFGWSESMN